MGNEESKSSAASKKCIAKLVKLGLRSEEVDHVLKLVGGRFVSRTTLRDMWNHLLTPKLMDLYEEYLLSRSDKKNGPDTIDEITFCTYLSNFVKGTTEERSNLYLELLRTKEGFVLVETMIEYSVELMKSVFQVMAKKNIDQYKQWSERGSDFTDDAIRRWSSAVVRNVCNPNEVTSLSQDEIVLWTTLNTDVILLQCYLFHSLYDMEKLERHEDGEQMRIQCPLPYLEFNVGQGHSNWNAIIDTPAVIFLNSHLPSENRYQWRLAYSADIHGEGFTNLCSSICNRGPTILIIRDKDNHVFGGYASTGWRIGPQFFGDERCFLFSLRPVMKIHSALPRHNDHFLYLNAHQKTLLNGLGMGGQPDYWGLWIDASFEFGTCSPSCSTYADYKMLSGSPKFQIVALEVWCTEGDPKDVEEGSDSDSVAEKDEKKKSILDKDPTARVMLDMISQKRAVRDYLESVG